MGTSANLKVGIPWPIAIRRLAGIARPSMPQPCDCPDRRAPWESFRREWWLRRSLPERGASCAVRRQLFLRIDDNYFSRSTTITPCPAGGAKRRCQTSLEMSPLAPSRRPRGFIHKIGFFLAAAGGRGGGKVGILVLDFHFSTAHNSRFFACLLFCLRHVTPAISTALPPSGFSWWRRPPPHSPSAWLSAC